MEKGTLHIENDTITQEQVRTLLYGEQDPVIAGLAICLMGLFTLVFGIAILVNAAKGKE